MIRFLFFLICPLLFFCSCRIIKTGKLNHGKGKRDTVVIRDTVFIHDTVFKNKPIRSTEELLREKYSKYLGIPVDSLTNLKLYAFIDKWWATPFKQGGINENGIDCSAFIQRLLNEVYNLKLPRTSIQQLYSNRVELFKSKEYLSEGDIVFFGTMNNNNVSHVGIYLHNNRFVHSASSKGVTISNLQDPIWRASYLVGGRVKAHLAKN